MSEMKVPGIDGSEAIGFLAGMGLARTLSLSDALDTVHWKQERGRWNLALGSSVGSIDQVAEIASRALLSMAADDEFGPAHVGDKIGVSPDRFRVHSVQAVKDYVERCRNPHLAQDGAKVATGMTVAALSAGGSDAILNPSKKEEIAVSALSFSNGNSGQLLLKDFRNAASLCVPSTIEKTLIGKPDRTQITSLNWDPSDQRAAAHRWHDPASEKSLVDPGINALAFVGMSFFTSVPNRGLKTVGWKYAPRPRGMVWPVWDRPVSLHVAETLICHCLDPRFLRRGGMVELRFSRVTNPDGKRNYFAPGRSLSPDELST